MRILYLAHRIPYPPNKGDKIRSFNEIKHLAGSHEVDLACLVDDPADLRYTRNLERICSHVLLMPFNPGWAALKGLADLAGGKPLSVGYFYSRSIQRTVDQWLFSRSYDIVVCFSSPMAEYILRSEAYAKCRGTSCNGSKARTGKLRLIMDFCDVDSDK